MRQAYLSPHGGVDILPEYTQRANGGATHVVPEADLQ